MNMTQWIDQVLEEWDHITKFVKYINDKLGITNENSDNNKIESNNYKIKENSKLIIY